MDVYGLLITKGDSQAFGDWCRSQLPFYRSVVCLDGSDGDETATQAIDFPEKLIYLHERRFLIPSKCDHALRRVVHDELVARFGENIWIMCCHTDEFCYHDPRTIAAKADRDGFDQVSWFTPHFYPHPSEFPDIAQRLQLPVQERFSHYHWSHHGNGFPWIEDRLYKSAAHVAWDASTHGSVRPHGLYRPAPYHPLLRHFKVCSVNLSEFETGRPTTLYSQHWQDQPAEFRTGLPYSVQDLQDLFVTSVRNYACCSQFTGRFDVPWNMGDQYCPDVDGRARESLLVEPVHLPPLIPQFVEVE